MRSSEGQAVLGGRKDGRPGASPGFRGAAADALRLQRRFSGSVAWLAPIAFAVTLAVLGFVNLGRRTIWYDEAVSWSTLNDWSTFIFRLKNDAFNAFYYTLLRGWTVVGQDEIALRSLSLLFAVLGVATFWVLGRRLVGARLASLAALLLVLNPFLIRYAQEARTYALAFFLVNLATLLFVRALDRPGRIASVGYVLVAVLALYAHFFAAAVIAAHAAYLITTRAFNRRWATTFFAIGVGGLPLLGALLFASRQLDWIWPTTPDVIARVFRYISGDVDESVWAGIAYGALGLVGLVSARTSRAVMDRKKALLVPLWFLVGFLLPVALSFIKPNLVPRYFIVVLPALVLLVAMGISWLRWRPLQVAATVAMVAISLAGIWRGYTAPYEDWRAAAADVAASAHARDAVVILPADRLLPFRYYDRSYPSALETMTAEDPVNAGRLVAPGTTGVWILTTLTDPPSVRRTASLEDQLAALNFKLVAERAWSEIEGRYWSRPG